MRFYRLLTLKIFKFFEFPVKICIKLYKWRVLHLTASSSGHSTLCHGVVGFLISLSIIIGGATHLPITPKFTWLRYFMLQSQFKGLSAVWKSLDLINKNNDRLKRTDCYLVHIKCNRCRVDQIINIEIKQISNILWQVVLPPRTENNCMKILLFVLLFLSKT